MNKIPETIDKEVLNTFPQAVFPGRIILIYTLHDAQKAIAYLNMQSIVGVDTETRPSFTKGKINKVSLLQISTTDTCFLFRLNYIGIPDVVKEFLQNDVLKIGLSLKDDFMMLAKREAHKSQQGEWIELQDYVRIFGIKEKSLQKIYALLFGEKISKRQQLSNWENEVLTDKQQQYAATDAWACLRIYTYLEELRKTGNYTNTPLHNELSL
ncbi:MAG: 3'-5' exonuclease [Phocaeicola sp.]|nr:3'-5' exonuclease [Phocaeicola sp.]